MPFSNKIALVFSARRGNCYDFARHLFPESRVLALGDYRLEHCSLCNYQCLSNAECPKDDDMIRIFQRIREAQVILLFSPVYDGRPPAVFYILEERLPSFWRRTREGFNLLKGKRMGLVCAGNSETVETARIIQATCRGMGCDHMEILLIRPDDYPLGGGIKGGLVDNQEIISALDKFYDKVIEKDERNDTVPAG